MEDARHRAIIERLDLLNERVRTLGWSLFVLVLGLALWYGLTIGPAILVGWAVRTTFGLVIESWKAYKKVATR